MAYLKKTICLLLVFSMLFGILPQMAGAEETSSTVAEIPEENIQGSAPEAIDLQDPEGTILPEDLSGEQGEVLLEMIGGETLPMQPEILRNEQQINELIVTGSVMDAAYPVVPAPACALSELTTVDYVAFSSLAYLNFDSYATAFDKDYESVGGYITIQDALVSMGLWTDGLWSKRQNITYAQLCEHIAGWRVLTYYNHSDVSGFYAVVFQNEDREAVIAYRGSVPPEQMNESSSWDILQDWLAYDFNVQIDKDVPQIEQFASAFELYRKVVNAGRSASTVATTGHSLGGGLSNLVAARYGCIGESVNAISVLDALYYHQPLAMGENYHGINRWGFKDHANMYDIAAGMYEQYFGVKIKPYSSYYNNVPNVELNHNAENELTSAVAKLLAIGTTMLHCPALADCHSMDSIVRLNSNKKVVMMGEHSNFRVVTGTTSNLDNFKAVDFGWSGSDEFSFSFFNGRARAMLGGDGTDYLTASNKQDKLVGGRGNDTLCGGSDDDIYIYYKGDGYDTIQDSEGSDCLYMCNFSSSDGINIVTDSDYDYIYVKHNGDDLVRIAKQGRRVLSNDSFKIIIVNTDGTTSEFDITSAFRYNDFWAYLDVACPVSVEILDADGNVVFTVEDGAVGYHITDYGNFYIYKEEEGSYGKHLELVDGYTARIVGNDSGTMDISYAPATDEGAGAITSVTDVPVSAAFTAEVQLEQTGEAILTMDTDGDGATDMVTEITNPCGENLSWIFDETTGSLTIHGEGDMYDFTDSDAPWNDFKDDIKSVIIEEGITSLGSNAFADCTALASIRFDSDAPAIDETAFRNVTATAFYPAGNTTWSKDILQNYGGTISWENICYGEHVIVTDEKTEPTCTETGLTEGSHCSVCQTVIVAQEPIPAKGHTEVIDKAVAATCTTTGLTEGKHCSVCDTVIAAQKTIPAKGHSYDDNVDGTCNSCSVNRETVEIRKVTHMFRMYNPNTGEHFYTGSEVEKGNLVAVGWQYEGVGFTFPANTGAPVHRLFQPSTGEHLYTMDEDEKAKLMADGWNYEGIAFNSAYDTEAVQHRLHNPNATVGAYHFTFSEEEKQNLINVGWEYQGIGWYSCWK